MMRLQVLTKKRRTSKEPGQTRTKKSPLTAFHCTCGELFTDDDELVNHKQQNMFLPVIGIVKSVMSK